MFTFTAKQFFSYTLLPGIVPRLKSFVSSGLGPIPGLVAHIFRAARLLPAGHPYLLGQNTGKFGLRHVLIAGAANLRWSRQNIDQIIIYFSVVAGFVLLAMQAALFCLALLAPTAKAADDLGSTVVLEKFVVNGSKVNEKLVFSIGYPTDDLAYVLMDRIFGVPGIFVGAKNPDGQSKGTCLAQNIACFDGVSKSNAEREKNRVDPEPKWPWPAHDAMKGLFKFYSTGLLIVAATILFYYIVAVSVETAQSGTPFGKRFNHVWAPLRIVLALGLLIPTANGLNVAQYLVLYSAKFGSAMATNAWLEFADIAIKGQTAALASKSEDGKRAMVVVPPTPKVTTILEFMTVVQTCRAAYADFKKPAAGSQDNEVNAYIILKDGNGKFTAQDLTGANYEELVKGGGQNGAGKVEMMSDFIVHFGVKNSKSSKAGGIDAVCGQIGLPVYAVEPSTPLGTLQRQYFEVLRDDLWKNENLRIIGQNFARKVSPVPVQTDPAQSAFEQAKASINADAAAANAEMLKNAGLAVASAPAKSTVNEPLPASLRQSIITGLETKIRDLISKAALKEVNEGKDWISDLKTLGWGGAGIWYNKIAQMNGSMISVSQALPSPQNMPTLMELVRDHRRRIDGVFMGRETFRPVLDKKGEKAVINWPVPGEDQKAAEAMWEAYDSWTDAGTKPSGNILIDAIKSFFGLTGLFDLVNGDNTKKHPMAQLSAIGKGMVDASIAHLTQSGIAFGFGALGAATTTDSLMSIGFGIANMLFVVATIGMTVGFLLFYIIPILPFLYFFFAVANWVKSIFEAMIGVPLWALAHLRIDGHNLAGDQAMGGYNLLFEIFLRPILIVFALLGSIVVFSAQAEVLRNVWGELTNVMQEAGSLDTPKDIIGGLRSDAIDNFFFLIVYALLLYMIANASFKMIDIIPRSILRWMGVSADVFDDGSGDLAGDLVRHTATGVGTASTLMRGTMQSATGEISAMRKQMGEINRADAAEKAAGGEKK